MYGSILVDKMDEDEYADFTIRTLQLTQVMAQKFMLLKMFV